MSGLLGGVTNVWESDVTELTLEVEKDCFGLPLLGTGDPEWGEPCCLSRAVCGLELLDSLLGDPGGDGWGVGPFPLA